VNNVDEIISAWAAAIPKLPGARCRGRSDTWDEYDDPELVEYAIHQCNSCPALDQCRAYLAALKPSQRPTGVVAATVIRPRKPRKAA
jgi:hypothetical protein